MKLIKVFVRVQSCCYHRGKDPEVARKWIRSHEQCHGPLRIHDGIRARTSGFMLRGDLCRYGGLPTHRHGEPST
ncbi:hypothetical protein Syun_018043 [Stephania yunnanensis]|uniref:Uncharacterized protein n=1 Tax=Stephania yunnanensis TaxID=152371 RepID=A0AAP0IRL8_9MAGN